MKFSLLSPVCISGKVPLLLVAVCNLLLFSLQEGMANLPVTVSRPGEPRQRGNPLEPARNTVIGPEGGRLVSSDGKLRMTIPAGALDEDTEFSITAISSSSGASLGRSYRISPQLQFKKAVSVSLSFKAHADSVGDTRLLLPGMQDAQGVWQMETERSVDDKEQTVTIETQQTGDWSLIMPFRLRPGYSLIQRGDKVVLRVVSYIGENPDDFFIRPPRKMPVEAMHIVPDEWIKRWAIVGAGVITRRPDGAMYAAPPNSAGGEKITVLAYYRDVPKPLKALIEVKKIQTGVAIQLEGEKEYKYFKAKGFVTSSGITIEWEVPLNGETWHGTITTNLKGKGSVSWTSGNQFNWEPENMSPRLFYQSYWDDGLKISTGFVDIWIVGKVGDMIEGIFEVADAGEYKTATADTDNEYRGVKTIRGQFVVPRQPDNQTPPDREEEEMEERKETKGKSSKHK